jgi:hypothetical protein
VRANFHEVKADFGVPQPDIAIALLPDDFLPSINRRSLKQEKITLPNETEKSDQRLTGVACGFPERNRNITDSSIMGMKDFGKGFVYMFAHFDSITEHNIRIIDEIKKTNGVNNLSGMSGGPMFWSTEYRWGLAGIIKSGDDLIPRFEYDGPPDSVIPTINVSAEPLLSKNIKRWIIRSPKKNSPIRYQQLFILHQILKDLKPVLRILQATNREIRSRYCQDR